MLEIKPEGMSVYSGITVEVGDPDIHLSFGTVSFQSEIRGQSPARTHAAQVWFKDLDVQLLLIDELNEQIRAAKNTPHQIRQICFQHIFTSGKISVGQFMDWVADIRIKAYDQGTSDARRDMRRALGIGHDV